MTGEQQIVTKHLESHGGVPTGLIASALAAGAGWTDIVLVLIQQVLPIAVKWLEDWIAGHKPPVPTPPPAPTT